MEFWPLNISFAPARATAKEPHSGPLQTAIAAQEGAVAGTLAFTSMLKKGDALRRRPAQAAGATAFCPATDANDGVPDKYFMGRRIQPMLV
jgi:hypothetical protein